MKLLLGLLVTASLLVIACSSDNEPGSPTHPSAASAEGAAGESVTLGDDAATSCVELYSLTTLTNRAFAFDGTVIAIEPATDTSPNSLAYAQVTFEVHEWFRADGPDRVTVEMNPPGYHSTLEEADYAVGSRLLISGEPRWGGEPLHDPIVWSCGFSRTHSAETAADWAEALSSGSATWHVDPGRQPPALRAAA